MEQGEKDDKMFILRSGQAVACIAGEKGEIEVKQYSTRAHLLFTSRPLENTHRR